MHIVGTNEILSKEWQKKGHVISQKQAFWVAQADSIPKKDSFFKSYATFGGGFFMGKKHFSKHFKSH